MKKRYYLSMLSVFPLIMVFNTIYFFAHKSVEMYWTLNALHFILLIPFNFIGIYFLYKPIAEAFKNEIDDPKARDRIQKLAWYSTIWIFFLGALYFGIMIILLYNTQVDTGDVALEKMPSIIWLTAVPSILYIYAILPGFIAYFVVNDFILDLKAKALTQFGYQYPVGKKKIGLTILIAFIVLSFIPSILVTLELIASKAGEEYTEFSNMTPLQAILPDRIIVFIGMVFAVIFIARSFTKPIYFLLKEINNVRAGDFSVKAAVVTEDEIGVLTNEFNEMVEGLKERELIRDTFGKYVTEDVAKIILDKKINVEGEVRQCTILVTDIANYTTISEGLTPNEIVVMLNEYFSEVVNIIKEHKGVVNKFIGDSIFAMFNVPLDDPKHALNAVQAAIKIKEITSLKKFGNNQQLITRIGINTGEAVAGNIGSADRMEYTVIGDDVNIASRLEQLNKDYNTQILIGENTYEAAKGHFDFSHLGGIRLKGKEKEVRVFKLIAD